MAAESTSPKRDFKRSPTIFVKNVSAERRKNILKIRYHSANAENTHKIFDYLRVILSLAGCIIILSTSIELKQNAEEYFLKSPGSYWSSVGFACLTAASTYEALRFFHYKQFLLFVTSGINVASLISLCVCFAVKESRVDTKAVDVMNLVTGCLILAHAITFNISYRTFSGLYAPLVPSSHSPTVLPISGLFTLGASLLVTAMAMALVGAGAPSPQESGYISAQKWCQLGAFIAWTVAAWGEVGVVFVSSRNAKRRKLHRDELEARQIQERKLLYTPPSQDSVV
eukprot:Gregarina_sp_Poly_1__967@NODE_1235_length_4691_cov_205_040441_g841_i0_p2_GENE_NODE_1235_length_4691_cov_205_040441_g841_i0NODE_1235_length_4691_cov_205_040441_g841_i0_p2_ORF_typecomplete_len284_score21_49DUF2417/PF10329_9/0_0056Gaa1/PF04114_14/0_3Clclike/PF07062_12/5e02Clclike/PF07062_12/0_14Clclike/PF07062_12/5_2e03_NODE_1235_length_4691_cov_205_040441_g841_i037724623